MLGCQIANNDHSGQSHLAANLAPRATHLLFWVQDFSMAGHSIEEVRQADIIREGVQVTIEGMTGGTYAIRPFDTWQGVYLEAFEVACVAGQVCQIPLPAFQRDMAFQVERK